MNASIYCRNGLFEELKQENTQNEGNYGKDNDWGVNHSIIQDLDASDIIQDDWQMCT